MRPAAGPRRSTRCSTTIRDRPPVDARWVKAILAAAAQAGYAIEWSLETHAHADHLSGAPCVKASAGARIGIGESIREVPGATRLFLCHDYKAPGRDRYAWETTVADERRANVRRIPAPRRRAREPAELRQPRRICSAMVPHIRTSGMRHRRAAVGGREADRHVIAF